MEIELSEEPISGLRQQADISIAFEVDRLFDVEPRANAATGFRLAERSVATPYTKDYDAIDGEGPGRWAERFDVSKWGYIVARLDGHRVGGAVIAFDTAGVEMLEGRRDLAVLWDVRVCPGLRGSGVGSALFEAAETWAAARGCRQIKVETQNINARACRFYAKHGCTLRRVERLAYAQFPDEVRLLFYKDITAACS
ncbi:MAG TPA: GNAT family N-acetyltransferase [Tepidisphaeraceae bacterium]|nr:GNAT family N-acetyltransferase [Tepidisphaeraceae bacterium]